MLPPTVIAFGQTWCWICKLKNSRKTRYLPKLQMALISKHFFDDLFLYFLSVILAQLSHIVTYSFWCFNVTLYLLICNQYICNRCLMVSTNQAYPSSFYFRISWILMKEHWFYFFSSPPFNAGPQKPRTLTSSKNKNENSWPKI